jgi:hypothetical protein
MVSEAYDAGGKSKVERIRAGPTFQAFCRVVVVRRTIQF